MTFPEYTEFDGIGLAELVRRGQVSANELLDAAIERVEALDPRLNAIVHRMDDPARRQIATGLGNGPFAGVPFLLKDHGIKIVGAPNRNGSRFHDDRPARANSFLTERYLAAGLVIFGKTNTPEFAISGSTEPQAFGPCRNPWDLTRGTGGSSGGSAAAVAAGYAPMAHASDGGGSIRNPASGCGVFGLKPTRGRVVCGPDSYQSLGGMSVHHAVTGSVRDSAALLDATTDPLVDDLYRKASDGSCFLDAIDRPPKQLRIAFHLHAHRDIDIDPECRRATRFAAGLCEDLGHLVEEAKPDIDGDEALELGSLLWKVGAAQIVAATAGSIGRKPRAGELEWITQLLADQGAEILATDYADAIDSIHRIGRKLAVFFERYDVVLSPVLSQPPWPIGVYENQYTDSRSYFETVANYSPFCWPYNMSGQPAMSAPLHWTENGLPVGVQFAGRYGDEVTLLQLAKQFEQIVPWFSRRPHAIIGANR